jgi:hypothetical protein
MGSPRGTALDFRCGKVSSFPRCVDVSDVVAVDQDAQPPPEPCPGWTRESDLLRPAPHLPFGDAAFDFIVAATSWHRDLEPVAELHRCWHRRKLAALSENALASWDSSGSLPADHYHTPQRSKRYCRLLRARTNITSRWLVLGSAFVLLSLGGRITHRPGNDDAERDGDTARGGLSSSARPGLGYAPITVWRWPTVSWPVAKPVC